MSPFARVPALSRRESSFRGMREKHASAARNVMIAIERMDSLLTQSEAEDPAADLCTICYTNTIQPGTQRITDTTTMEFTCGHRFCFECSRRAIGQ